MNKTSSMLVKILGRLNQSYCSTDKVTSLHNTHFVLVISYTLDSYISSLPSLVLSPIIPRLFCLQMSHMGRRLSLRRTKINNCW